MVNPTRTVNVGSVVTDSHGRQGRVGEELRSEADDRHVSVKFDGEGPRLLLPTVLLQPCDDGSFHIPVDAEALAAEGGPPSEFGAADPTIIPVAAEKLRIERRPVETGRVRVRKIVQETEEVVDEPLSRWRADVDRRPVGEWVDEYPSVRTDGDTVIIPVVEEVLVLSKRLRLVEEVHIHRSQETFHAPQRVKRNREEAVVERLGPEGATDEEHWEKEPDQQTLGSES